MTDPSFPPDFVWGAATSAYQIEGAVAEDGRGESIWDRFAHTPGRVANGDTGDVACDHYHRWPEDVALMGQLGLRAYRFSIAWPRVLPEGRGRVNAKGLDFYDRLVDGLLTAGIEPWPTLYHWDLPIALQDAGGWPNRDTALAFVDYADAVTRCLGDRVDHWMTINEPWVVTYLGHALGVHPPGHADWAEAVATAHHLLLAHGLSVPVVRANSPGARVGIVLNLSPARPASGSDLDAAAAERFDGMLNRWYLDPLAGRGYPADLLARFGAIAPPIVGDDLATISTPTDFLGVNYYFPFSVAGFPGDDPISAFPVDSPIADRTAMGWPVVPGGLADVLNRLHRDYAFGPLLVTENGAAFDDPPPNVGRVDDPPPNVGRVDDPPPNVGRVDDPARIDYITRHLAIVREAIAAGIPVEGYFVWSLLDNFEWTEGFSKRFGIVHVDFATQRRTVKASGRWYARVVAANRLVDPGLSSPA